MSRNTRPQRRCGFGPRFVLARALVGDSMWPVAGSRLVRKARVLGCRPAQLRRCLEGRPVSARAAERIFEAAELIETKRAA
jgi:hypothetical protein